MTILSGVHIVSRSHLSWCIGWESYSKMRHTLDEIICLAVRCMGSGSRKKCTSLFVHVGLLLRATMNDGTLCTRFLHVDIDVVYLNIHLSGINCARSIFCWYVSEYFLPRWSSVASTSCNGASTRPRVLLLCATHRAWLSFFRWIFALLIGYESPACGISFHHEYGDWAPNIRLWYGMPRV